jgi:pimeloyl-ACP methyl ester carboxylesterase
LLLALAGFTRLGVWRIERANPPVGTFADINGNRIHYVHVPAGPAADLPPVVFIHGASANLNDPMTAFLPLLKGRAELLFFDRPGHGWSTNGTVADNGIDRQADTIAGLMDKVGIKSAIIVGHSFGGSVAASFILGHPDKAKGVVFLSAATHPWPGCSVAGYYTLTGLPVIGRIFSETIALPAGMLRLEKGSACVFHPNPVPDNYTKNASISLLLRPSIFRANAIQVNSLCADNAAKSVRYPTIKTPTIVISGNEDTVVLEEIHSKGLARDIPGSELVWVDGLGHKPDYAATGLAVEAIEKLSGLKRDLQSSARALETKLKSTRVNCEAPVRR